MCVCVCARVGHGKEDLGSVWQKGLGNAGGAPCRGVCSCSCTTGLLTAMHLWDAEVCDQWVRVYKGKALQHCSGLLLRLRRRELWETDSAGIGIERPERCERDAA